MVSRLLVFVHLAKTLNGGCYHNLKDVALIMAENSLKLQVGFEYSNFNSFREQKNLLLGIT